MSRKKKNQQDRQSDLTIAKLAVLAAVLQIAVSYTHLGRVDYSILYAGQYKNN